MSRLKIFYSYNGVTIDGEDLDNLGYARHLRTLSREGSLSCHTCYDMGPRFTQSRPKVITVESPGTEDPF